MLTVLLKRPSRANSQATLTPTLSVLGSTRTGLIFTGIQEGTQPVGLTPPGQTEPGITYHVPHAGFRWGGAGRRELCRGWGGHSGGAVRESGSVLWALFCGFVLCIPLFCIVVVIVPFVCCSVKLPLSRPTGFCLFLSILLRTPVGGGAATWRFCYRLQPNQNTQTLFFPFGYFLWLILPPVKK